MNLIIPMAGRSSRFPDVKPKWMLTHPSGNFMVIEAIRGLNLNDFKSVYFIYLQEHEEQHHFLKGFREELEDLGLSGKSKFVSLNKSTRDQPETVEQGILQGKISGPMLIKDSDNFFRADVGDQNGVCFADLNKVGLIKPKNKSYITTDARGNVVNIVEKLVISSSFCVGGYAFSDAALFLDGLSKLDPSRERYISHVIYQLMLGGKTFQAIETESYSDWGTIEDWDRFKKSYGTLFIDLDGTLVKNSSAHFPPYVGQSEPILPNIEIVRQLQQSGKFEIIITTSRPEKFRAITEAQLDKLGIRHRGLIMGLQHSKRIIINDYSKSNPYKSCDAINLKRNADDLREIMRESLGIDYEEI
ncbi:MAG: hypothetical protein U0289_10240 [Cyclobacteriaceae bacterium]